MLLELWKTLNAPQAVVICVALIGILFGLGPVAVRCGTRVVMALLTAVLAAIAAAWPAFGKASTMVTEILHRQWRTLSRRRPPNFAPRPFTAEEAAVAERLRERQAEGRCDWCLRARGHQYNPDHPRCKKCLSGTERPDPNRAEVTTDAT
jgi:hypothetical protein